jgi:hypothetical protein
MIGTRASLAAYSEKCLETHGQRFTRPETIAHLRQRGAAPGFANAQQELNLSTSAISTYMSQLEARWAWCCAIAAGRVQPDQQGRAVPSGNPAPAGELEGFEQYAAALKGELRGTLNLGVIDSTVSDKALPFAEAIGAYSQEHPAVHLHLSVLSPYELQLGCRTTAWTWPSARFPRA